MSEPQFFQTKMGRDFYDKTLPEIARQLARLNELLERMIQSFGAPEEDGDAAP